MSFSSTHLYFDDVAVGQEWESSGRTVTETDIVYAKTTPYRRPIAHGLLVFSMGSGLGVMCPPMRTIAFAQVREWNFREPIFIGDTIRLRSRVMEKTLKGRGRRGEIVWYRGVLNQEGKIVQEGVLVTLVEGRVSKRPVTEAVAEVVTAEPSEPAMPALPAAAE
jgi:3-hydroxybutyryl-CoA dehydratase